MFKKILVPVDGSEGSWRALNDALEIGAKFGSELVIVNVIQPFNNAALLAMPGGSVILDRDNTELEEIGNHILELAKEKVGAYPYKADYLVEVGHPSERILAIAGKSTCDAIVIGSRGLSGIAEFFLGSVSSKVAQYANIPVLITK